MEVSLKCKEHITPDIATFYWSTPNHIIWRAGQYGVFYLPHDKMDTSGPERFFTISNAPASKQLAFTTRISNSSFKQALNELAIGDPIHLQSIGGDFTLTNNSSDSYLFIAIGLGITPFRAILSEAIEQGATIKTSLLYQHKSMERLFPKELTAYQTALNGNLQEFDHVTDIAQYLLTKISELKHSKFYVAGPIPAVELLEDVLLQNSIDQSNIYGDYFEYDWGQLSTDNG